jgi:hypothetical protein
MYRISYYFTVIERHRNAIDHSVCSVYDNNINILCVRKMQSFLTLHQVVYIVTAAL